MKEINALAELSKPFQDHEIEWRAQTFTENNGSVRVLMLPYIDSRAVMKRLDDVLGVHWKDDYLQMQINGQQAFQCSISIYDSNQWITRTDGAECTDFESVKGGYSSAFKRAAVKFGIGRYLYNLDGHWCTVEDRGSIYVKGKIGGQNGSTVKGYVNPPSITQLMARTNQKPNTEQSDRGNQSQQRQQQQSNQQSKSQNAVEILNKLLAKLNYGSNIIPYLLERAGSNANSFENATGQENQKVYHALTALEKYLDICHKNRLTLEQVIYYAQIVAKKPFQGVQEMIFEMDYKKVEEAVELLRSDMTRQNTTA